MRKLRLATAALAVLGSLACANAADLAVVRKAPEAAPPPSWSGFYIGAGVGTKRSESNWTTTCFGAACQTGGVNFFFVDSSSPRSFSDTAFRGSLYAGYNWQIFQWVVGLEADIGFGNRSKTTAGIPGCTTFCGSLPPTPDDIDSASVKWRSDSSIRVRAGYLLMPNVLLYGTGGFARQGIEANVTCSFAGPWCFPPAALDVRSETHSATLNGWTAGAGLEWMIYGHWLLRGEYRYSRFGRIQPVFFGGTADDVFTDIRTVTHIATFGVAYKL